MSQTSTHFLHCCRLNWLLVFLLHHPALWPFSSPQKWSYINIYSFPTSLILLPDYVSSMALFFIFALVMATINTICLSIHVVSWASLHPVPRPWKFPKPGLLCLPPSFLPLSSFLIGTIPVMTVATKASLVSRSCALPLLRVVTVL